MCAPGQGCGVSVGYADPFLHAARGSSRAVAYAQHVNETEKVYELSLCWYNTERLSYKIEVFSMKFLVPKKPKYLSN
jgi:hypothetical protein